MNGSLKQRHVYTARTHTAGVDLVCARDYCSMQEARDDPKCLLLDIRT